MSCGSQPKTLPTDDLFGMMYGYSKGGRWHSADPETLAEMREREPGPSDGRQGFTHEGWLDCTSGRAGSSPRRAQNQKNDAGSFHEFWGSNKEQPKKKSCFSTKIPPFLKECEEPSMAGSFAEFWGSTPESSGGSPKPSKKKAAYKNPFTEMEKAGQQQDWAYDWFLPSPNGLLKGPGKILRTQEDHQNDVKRIVKLILNHAMEQIRNKKLDDLEDDDDCYPDEDIDYDC